jgi:hypothetical protein
MKPRLLDPLRERAHERRSRRGNANYGRRASDARNPTRPVEQAVAPPQVPGSDCDPDAERVRRAGGPLDQATYSCSCGYLFSAAVCTTVVCPHCGSSQAW